MRGARYERGSWPGSKDATRDAPRHNHDVTRRLSRRYTLACFPNKARGHGPMVLGFGCLRFVAS